MGRPGIRAYATIAIVVVFTLFLEAYSIYKSPGLMLEEMVLATVPMMTVAACIISSVLCVAAVFLLKVKWWVLYATVVLSALATFIGLIVVISATKNSDFFSNLYRHQGSLYSVNPTLQIGTVQPNVLADIRGQLHPDYTLYAVDGTQANTAKYWFIFIDNSDGSLYRIGFFNATDKQVSQCPSIYELWSAVQKERSLPSSSYYLNFDGIPTHENGNSLSELQMFARDRTISFHTSDGKVYTVTLLPTGNDMRWTISGP